MLLIDLRPQKLTGKDAESMLDEINITVNKNTIPFDPESPFVTSGLRMGTPALTTRGFTTADMDEVADIIAQALTRFNEKGVKAELKSRVKELCQSHPLYE